MQNGKLSSEQTEVHAGVGLNLAGRPCRDAWHNLGTLSQDDAMKRYITLVDKLDPGWEGKKDETSESSPNWAKVLNKGYQQSFISYWFIFVSFQSNSSSSTGSLVGGPVVSKLAYDAKEDIPDDNKTMFDWCKEGNVEMMQKKASGEMNQTDDQVRESSCRTNQAAKLYYSNHCLQGMGLIHWACDRGHLHIVEYLLSNGVDMNLQVCQVHNNKTYICINACFPSL